MITLSAPDILDENGVSTGVSDIAITPEGNIALADRLVALQQRVTQRLRFWLHESFLDYEDGVPYISGIFQRAVPVGLASTILVDHVMRISEVERVTDVVASVDRTTRRLSWSATVHATFGGSVVVSVEV